jgi:hypothetical protein
MMSEEIKSFGVFREGQWFINLTPHEIAIDGMEGERFRIPPSGFVARVKTEPGEDLGFIGGIPIRRPPVMGEVENLPSPVEGVVFIVSQIVANSVKREDVFYPDTGPDALRDEKGNIAAVRRLIRSV